MEGEVGNLGAESARVNVTTLWAPLLDTAPSGTITRIVGSTIRMASFHNLGLWGDVICVVDHPWLHGIPVLYMRGPCPRW